MLEDKKIILAVTGSIAAYKSAVLLRLLIKAGANVKVVMTEAAQTFIAPLTFSTLSKNPVYSTFVDREGAVWNNHVDLGLWADLIIIAPASANTLAKMSHGLCDNLLTAVYLSAKCPVCVAPAMDRDMWLHPSTQENIERIQSFGNQVISVETGELASGLVGAGRMAEPENIVQYVETFLADKEDKVLAKKTVLITAGPTQEAIDPVRFISNHSSGKMGIALADTAAQQGAKVQLVLGPSSFRPKHPNVEVISVKSAEDMFQAVDTRFDEAHLIIMAAAVADFTPETTSNEKIKKKGKDDGMSIPLKRTKDILKTMGERKKDHQMLVGFALETQNFIENAQRKLNKKNLDFIVLNSMREKGAGFQHDTNKVTILDRHNNIEKFELKSKQRVAKDILAYAVSLEQKSKEE